MDGSASSSGVAIESWTWIAVAAAMAVLFAPGAVSLGLALGAACVVALLNPQLPEVRPAAAAICGVAATPVFFYLRTNWLNGDGSMLSPKFERDVPLLGAHLSHDELFELFLHSRVWFYTERWWGWSVVFSYQVVSCVAGAVFVYALVRVARRLAPERTWLFLTGVVSGGYMQLFFGDVENYTITAVLILLYVTAACRFLAGELALWVPALALAVAACFHLEAGWLLPSAVYLGLVSRSRTGRTRDAWTSAALAGAIVAAVFVYFHFNGLPLRRFFSSYAGQALRLKDVFAIGMPRAYYIDEVTVLLRLCPAVAMLVPALAFSSRRIDETTRFLALAAASMLSMQAIWKSQLGVFDDWNLYAAGGLLTAIVIWRYVAAAAVTPLMRIAAAALAAVGFVHTYTWIVANHYYGR